jgi:hypothetical protein
MAGKGQPNSPHRRSRFTADKQNSRTWVKKLLILRLYLDSPGLTIGLWEEHLDERKHRTEAYIKR